jgi:hypothetical protein
MPTPQTAVQTAAESNSLSARWPRFGLALVLLVLPLVYFYPAVIGPVTLMPGDGWTQNFGVRVLLGQLLRAGHWPLWNPYIFAGTPLLASVYPGALYPPNWLFAVLSPRAAMNAVVITTYHLALIGTYLYARRIGCNRVGALLAGLAFSFGGFMIAHLGHTSRIAAAAWLPWILLALELLYQQARWRWVVLGAGCIALQLFAGEPQMNLYTIMVAGSYGLFSLLGRVKRERRLRFLSAALLMALGGVLLSLIQLLPEREFLSYGERASITYEYFSQFSLPPRQILILFFPYFFGGAATGPYQVSYWGQWNIPETTGYVGMATWLLACTAVLLSKPAQRPLLWFWSGCAVVALLLALGNHLPFDLHQALFHVPVYNLFRAPARNLLEFTFALAILAGLGATALTQVERPAARRAWFRAVLLLGLIAAISVVVYRFFAHQLVAETPLPPEAGALTNPDLYFPLIFLGLASVTAWFYFRPNQWSRRLAGPLLVVVLLLDAMSWGLSYEWVLPDFNVREQLADPPAVSFIKQRESELTNFRILSWGADSLRTNYRELNYPNVSIARGLQSVNGYDALRLTRLAELAGRMTLDGMIPELAAFNATHRGFDLLNVKYLLRETPKPESERRLVEHAGIQFDEAPVNLTFASAATLTMATQAQASELAIVSSLANSQDLPDGQTVLRVRLHTANGQVIERELQTGRDTAEWAYDRPDVKARIQHRRAAVIESWPSGNFAGHRYLTRLAFDRAAIQSVELSGASDSAELTIQQASLYDAQTKTSTPLNQFTLAPARWRKLAQFDAVELYENLHMLPRAWFVNRWQVLPKAQILRAIKTGWLPDGTPCDPREVALFEAEHYGARAASLPAIPAAQTATATLAQYEPNRLALETHNAQAGLLVLSEVYYRGWEARIDGQPAPIEQVNHLLRALFVPAGAHHIEFVFRAPSFRRGAWGSAAGVLLLVVGGWLWRRRDVRQAASLS